MTRPGNLFHASAFLLALGLCSLPAGAETVMQNTTVTQIEIPDARKVDFKAFDINHDGILSRAEVGVAELAGLDLFRMDGRVALITGGGGGYVAQ